LDDTGSITSADAACDGTECLGVKGVNYRVGIWVVVFEEVEDVNSELEIGRLGELESLGGGEVVVDETG
jgi:hypothetical protein